MNKDAKYIIEQAEKIKELEAMLRWVIEDSMCDGYSKKRKQEYYEQTIKKAEEGIKE